MSCRHPSSDPARFMFGVFGADRQREKAKLEAAEIEAELERERQDARDDSGQCILCGADLFMREIDAGSTLCVECIDAGLNDSCDERGRNDGREDYSPFY